MSAMAKRVSLAAILTIAVFGLALFAASPFSVSWSSEMEFTQTGSNVALRFFDSVFTLDYALGSLLSTSTSEFRNVGFLWQEFGLTGSIGAFDIQANLLFGPSTGDYVYAQEIVTLSIAGINLGFYWAYLGSAVFQGPASGTAIRLAATVASLDVISISEFGARIKDEDFDGITIYNALTGAYKNYITNPIVAVQTCPSCAAAFTGEKLTLSGMKFSCIENLTTTMYLSCLSGFDWIRFEIEDICTGLSWLSLDLELTFALQTKSIVVTPTLVLGECFCIDTYVDVRTGAPDDTLYGAFTSITGISLNGLGLTFAWNGVSVKALTALDTARYAITTPEFGSVIEKIADAVDDGHDFYLDYWELYSIEITQDGCCSGITHFLANAYFGEPPSGIFGWAMTHVEGKFAISSSIFLTTLVEVDITGLDHFGFGFEVSW